MWEFLATCSQCSSVYHRLKTLFHANILWQNQTRGNRRRPDLDSTEDVPPVPNQIHRYFPVLYIFTNPSTQAGCDKRSTFKRSVTSLNWEFSFSSTDCQNKAKESSLSYNLPIAGGRMIGFIPFPRVIVLCEKQSASSRIWTCVAVYISYDDDHYTTNIISCVIAAVCDFFWSRWNPTTDLRKSELIMNNFVCCTHRNSQLFRNIHFGNSCQLKWAY